MVAIYYHNWAINMVFISANNKLIIHQNNTGSSILEYNDEPSSISNYLIKTKDMDF